jgi:signal transduction histidine kinase
MSDGGTLILKTTQDPRLKTVTVQIADTGKGMAPQMLERIFEPFFTTKKKGSGLGLAVCKRLVEQHNGEIAVSSSPRQGAVFILTFPMATDKEVQAA